MTAFLHLGIDPGQSGAWALLDERGRLVDAGDMPIGDEDGRVDGEALRAAWADLVIEAATVERVGQITRIKGRAMGIGGRFNFGWNAGVPSTVLRILGIPVTYVDLTVWKPAVGVTADKKTSLALARRTWPAQAASLFKRAKDDGRAEAALIASYGLRHRALLRRAA